MTQLNNLKLEGEFPIKYSGWGSAMNRNLRAIDFFLQPRVLDSALTAPPGSPAFGDGYIIAASATGAWAGKDNQITVWNGTAWEFYVPANGFSVWVLSTKKRYIMYDGVWTTTMYTGNVSNESGSLFLISKATTTAQLSIRLAAGTDSLTTAINITKTQGNRARINFVGQLVCTSASQGSSTQDKQYLHGAGTPEGVITGRRGDEYSCTNGTGKYYKETGDNTNTGWRKLAYV